MAKRIPKTDPAPEAQTDSNSTPTLRDQDSPPSLVQQDTGQEAGNRTDSKVPPPPRQQSQTPSLAQPDTQQEAGNHSSSLVSDMEEAVESVVRETPAQATNRWIREGRRRQADALREMVRLECREAGMTQREAREESWRRAMAAFPPPGAEAEDPPEWECKGRNNPSTPIRGGSEGNALETGGVRGLGSIPASWPEDLPANASLAAEVGWVQANRIRVVDQTPEGPVVRLERAGTPAPSWAALGWLETSIRAYSKYCDIAARATSGQADEDTHTRRERLAIEEIRALLAEMAADTCPHCGRQF